jgi:hypothetical protein
METKLELIKRNIIDYLEFDEEKWNNNKKILINDKWKPLLKGDWDREIYDTGHMDLTKYLNQKITKETLVKDIVSEIRNKNLRLRLEAAVIMILQNKFDTKIINKYEL